MILQPVTLILTLCLSLATFSSMAADEQDNPKQHDNEKKVMLQTKCPIQGGDIDKDVYVDYKGQRIYFCCPGCDKKFLANADKLIKEMTAKGITLAKTPHEQTICPVSGDAIDKDIFVEHEGQKVYLCCKMCRGKFKKDAATYMKKLSELQAAAEQEKKAKAHKKHEGSHMNH